MNKIILSSIVITLLCACGITREDLGFEKNSPDEMMVVSRAPLSIPPEFGLRPVIVEAVSVDEPDALSVGEQALLEKIK